MYNGTYAEVAENTSINLASVMNYRHAEKTAVKVPKPRRADIAATRYNTTIAMTGSIEERMVPRKETMRKMVRSEQEIIVGTYSLVSSSGFYTTVGLCSLISAQRILTNVMVLSKRVIIHWREGISQ
jgi:hypothetical protein